MSIIMHGLVPEGFSLIQRRFFIASCQLALTKHQFNSRKLSFSPLQSLCACRNGLEGRAVSRVPPKAGRLGGELRRGGCLLHVLFHVPRYLRASAAMYNAHTVEHPSVPSDEIGPTEATEAFRQVLQKIETCERQELHDIDADNRRVSVFNRRDPVGNNYCPPHLQLAVYELSRLPNSQHVYSFRQFLPNSLVSCELRTLLRHESTVPRNLQGDILEAIFISEWKQRHNHYGREPKDGCGDVIKVLAGECERPPHEHNQRDEPIRVLLMTITRN